MNISVTFSCKREYVLPADAVKWWFVRDVLHYLDADGLEQEIVVDDSDDFQVEDIEKKRISQTEVSPSNK